MPKVLVYCKRTQAGIELAKGLRKMGCEFRVCQESGNFMDRAVEERPDVVVLCFGAKDRWAEAGIAALKKFCADAKIIFATENPKSEDAKSLQRGVFYYGGAASPREILDAVNSATKDL